jgi:predicted O-methyltransferase YrrM
LNQKQLILKRNFIGIGSEAFPRWAFSAIASRMREYRGLREQLNSLRQATADYENPGDVFDELRRFPDFRSDQKRAEILPLLQLIAKDPPKFACEIGTALGGTLFLLGKVCASNATIITVDPGLSLVRRPLHRRMAAAKQRIICVRGDSHAPETLQRVTATLQENLLDCLFIDGDHSLRGVMADFANFSPLVRPGGIIVFHDIVPDHEARFGTDTGSWSGGVPAFWKLVASQYSSQEIVEDAGQDGYGLGVIRWEG